MSFRGCWASFRRAGAAVESSTDDSSSIWIDGWMGSVPGPRSSRDGQTGGGAMFVECINDRRFPCTFHRDEHSFARHRQPAGFADLCQVNTLYSKAKQSRNKSISSSSQNQKMQQPAGLRGNYLSHAKTIAYWSNANNATYVLDHIIYFAAKVPLAAF